MREEMHVRFASHPTLSSQSMPHYDRPSIAVMLVRAPFLEHVLICELESLGAVKRG